MNINIEAAADAIMSARSNAAGMPRPPFNREACEQIIHQHDKEVLRMAQRRARLAFLHSNNNDFDTLKKIEQAITYDDREACVKILRDAQMPQGNDELAGRLCQAWAKYVQFFTEPPHGTFKQIRAMLEFMP